MGVNNHEVTNYDVCNRFCLKCSMGIPHTMDFTGPAGGMESFLVVRACKKSVEEYDVIYDTFVFIDTIGLLPVKYN